jgi:hypothetical protein
MANPSPANSESLTRERLIDQRLSAAGWRVTPFVTEKKLADSDHCAVEEFLTEAELGTAEGRSYETAEEFLARIRGAEASRSLKTQVGMKKRLGSISQ